MKTLRLAFSFAMLSGVAAAAACSSDPDRASFTSTDPDAAVSHLPDANATDDAPSDAVVEARAPFDPNAEAVVCADSGPCALDLVAGQYFFCALMSDKTVRCWGDDTNGTLGEGAPPVDAGKDAGKDAGHDGGDAGDAGFVVGHSPALADVLQISAAATTACALLSTGDVKCWGANDSAQLGLTGDPATNDYDPHSLPAKVALTSAAARVDVGQRSACAVLASGDTWCWGDNEFGQLALSADTTYGAPAKFTAVAKIAQTGASTNTAFAIDDQGYLSSWGAVAGIEGAGVGGRVASSSPDLIAAQLAIPSPVTSFSVSSWFDYAPPYDPATNLPDRGIAHACAVSKGALYCWGDSVVGATGVGLPALVATPTIADVKSNAYPQQVAAAHEHTCVRLTDGAVHCAGDDSFGQLGRTDDGGVYAAYFTPAAAFTGHAVKIMVSDTTTCALEQGGQVMCWGGNQYGELGQGTTDTTAHRTPAAVRF